MYGCESMFEDLRKEFNKSDKDGYILRVSGDDTLYWMDKDDDVIYPLHACGVFYQLELLIKNAKEYRRHLMSMMSMEDIVEIVKSNDNMTDYIFCYLTIRKMVEEYFNEEIDD